MTPAAPVTPDTTVEKPTRRLRKLIGSTWSAAGTGLALVTAAAALTFQLWPALTPDPHTMLAADVRVQSVEPGVTLGQYEARYEPQALMGPVSPFEAQARKGPGNIVYLHVQVQGEKHGTVRLESFSYYWPSGKAVDQKPADSHGFNPGTPDDQWIAPVWVADPGVGRPFFIRMSVLDGDVLLAFADTKRIGPP
jgi:hypothetical protein